MSGSIARLFTRSSPYFNSAMLRQVWHNIICSYLSYRSGSLIREANGAMPVPVAIK